MLWTYWLVRRILCQCRRADESLCRGADGNNVTSLIVVNGHAPSVDFSHEILRKIDRGLHKIYLYILFVLSIVIEIPPPACKLVLFVMVTMVTDFPQLLSITTGWCYCVTRVRQVYLIVYMA